MIAKKVSDICEHYCVIEKLLKPKKTILIKIETKEVDTCESGKFKFNLISPTMDS